MGGSSNCDAAFGEDDIVILARGSRRGERLIGRGGLNGLGGVAYGLARLTTLLDDPECVRMMTEFIAARPELWWEDIGVDPPP